MTDRLRELADVIEANIDRGGLREACSIYEALLRLSEVEIADLIRRLRGQVPEGLNGRFNNLLREFRLQREIRDFATTNGYLIGAFDAKAAVLAALGVKR